MKYIECVLGLHSCLEITYIASGYVAQIVDESSWVLCKAEGDSILEAITKLDELISKKLQS